MLAAHIKDRLTALLPDETTGFAIAYSGGADSTALLYALKDHPQLKVVYVLDHGLRTGSKAEAINARDFARSLGLKAELLSWRNQGVQTAIQERARAARYGIIGQACREAGIKYLLTGHHQDDQAETLLMRFEHKTGWRGAAGIAEMTYAPIWPEMALVTIVRPLLDMPRQILRDYNKEHNLSWAEDPSNDNDSFERVRIRKYLAQAPDVGLDLLNAQTGLRQGLIDERRKLGEFARKYVKINEHGIIRLGGLCSPELLYHLLRVASGEGRMINRAKITRLLQFMETARFTSATLGGALIRRNPSDPGFLICRDLGAVTGRKDNPHGPQDLQMTFSDKLQIWDGRYMLSGPSEYSLNTIHATRDIMTEIDLKRLREHPAAVRQTLPVVMKNGEIIGFGGQKSGETGPYLLKSLIQTRLEATLGINLTP